MAKMAISLQPSETVLVRVAGNIYSAYIAAGRVPEGKEQEWIQRAIREAFYIARTTDDAVQSDDETW